MALGATSTSSGKYAIALGGGTTASAANSVAIGANSVASRDNSVSLGSSTQQRQLVNLAAGTEATDAVNKGQLDAINTALTAATTKAQATADDAKTKLSTLDGLAVKYDSTSKDRVTLGGAGTTGTVTLGNVKAGTADTDAVNKGQLDTVQTAATKAQTGLNTLDGLAVKYDSTLKDRVTLGGTGTTGTVALGNVKAGISSNDAVNVSQLKPMVDALGGGATMDAKTGAVSGPSYAIQGGTYTTVGDALGKLDTITTKNTGDITTINGTLNNLTSGTAGLVQQDATTKAITVASGTAGTTVNIAGTAGDRQLKGMAAGTADTDGVNLKQLKGMGLTTDTAGKVTNAFVAYDSTSKDKVTLGGAGTTGTVTLSNVKAGTADTDAVNKGQLNTVQTAADKAQAGLNTLDGLAVKYDSTSKDKVTLGGAGTTGTVTLSNVKAGTADTDAVNKGQLDGVNTALNTAVTKAQTTADKAQTGLNTLDGLAVKYDSTLKDKVTLGGAGTTGTVTLSNVKAGTADTDAVNKGQLDTVQTAATKVQTGLDTLDGLAVKYDSTSKDKVTLGGAGTTGTATLSNVKAGTADTDAVNKGQLDTVQTAADKAQAGLNTLDGLAVKYDSTSKDKVTLGGAGTTGTVALGNVKAGLTSNDAVNVSQLKPMVDALGGGATMDTKTGAVSGPSYAIQGGTYTTVGDALGKLDTATTKNTGDITTINSTLSNITGGTAGLVQQDATTKAITVASGTAGTTVNIAGTAGDRQLKGMAAGTADTDGVNLKQLKDMGLTTDTAGNVTNAFVAYDSTSKDKVTLGGAGTTGTVTLSNVKAGTADTDAVNKGQLDTVQTAATKAQTGLDTLDGLAVKYDSTSKDKVTLGGAGTTGTVALGNVKAGLTSNDAVNVAQLKPMVDALGGGAAIDAKTGAVSGPSYGIQGSTYTTVGDALGKLDTATTKNTTDITKNTGDITNLSTAVNTLQNGGSRYFKAAGKNDDTDEAKASGKNSIAIGANSVAERDNSLSVGRAEIKDGTGTVTQTEITRQITNVADGTQAKDAVNKGQLDTVNTAATKAQTAADAAKSGLDTLDGLAVKYDSTSKDRVTLGGAGTSGTVTLGNVKAGIASNDAVNVSQLKPMVDALGGGATMDAKTGAVSGPSYAIQGSTFTTVGSALGKLDTITTKNTGDITTINSTLSNITSGTAGLVQQDATTKAITVASDKAGTTVNIAGTAGERQLKGMAAGTADTDGVNLKQLKGMGLTTDTAGNVTNAFVAYDSTSKDRVTLGGAGTTGTVALGNVKAGIASNDAVNVSQLKPMVDALGGGATMDAKTGAVTGPSYAIQGSTYTTVGSALGKLDTATTKNTGDITKNTGDITNLATTVNNLNAGTTGLVQQDAKSLDVTVAKTSGGNKVDIAGTAGVRALTGVKAGELSAASHDAVNGAQLYATNTSVTKNSGDITTLNTTLTQMSNDIKNGGLGLVTQDKQTGNIMVASNLGGSLVNVSGSGGARVLTGVANGTNDRDAVTIAQLKAVGLVDPSGKTLGAVVYDDLSLGHATLGGTNGTVLGNVANGKVEASSREAVNGSQLYAMQQSFDAQYNELNGRVTHIQNQPGQGGTGTGSNLVRAGTGNNSIVLSPTDSGSSASGDQALAMGAGAQASGANSVALGQGSIADEANVVSLGSEGHERRLTNVAPGSHGTDAVNMNQMQQGLSSMRGDMNQVARHAYAGVAAAAALTMIPDAEPGKNFSIGIAMANYRGYQATALGASMRFTPNLRARIGAGASAGGTVMGAGASYQW
ncbi:YadA-like family protein [Paraburkholderia hayleyella]|uniref:YadA-like family protein n=1 Tax=Paraburkholderia hayleyella TaxID=2152889 RepID=UPI00158037DB|nr:YadA-like family protein [Paraburkholderia hayleyella]